MTTPQKPRRQSSTLQSGGVVVHSDEVELSSCDKLYFSVIARFTVILTITSLVAAVFVLTNIQSYYKAAYAEVGGTVVDSVTEQVRSEVSKFFVPKFNIRAQMKFAIDTEQINTQDVWTGDAMGQYSDVMGPLFYADPDFLAAYSAMDNRQVLKYSAEEPLDWFTELRHYVNASYQERLRCSVTRASYKNVRNCEMAPPNVKSYDPFAKSWYITADETDGDCKLCAEGFAWEGPAFQTALAAGDTDKPVFNMLFRLNWPHRGEHSNFKVKFLIDQLKAVVDHVEVGETGDVAIVNGLGQILAAKSVAVKDIQEKDAEGNKVFKRIWQKPSFDMVTEEDLAPNEKTTIVEDGGEFVVSNPVVEVPGWRVLIHIQVEDFLPDSSKRVAAAGALSILSIVLTAVRTLLLLMAWGGQWYFSHRHAPKSKVAPVTGQPVKDVEAGGQLAVVPNGE